MGKQKEGKGEIDEYCDRCVKESLHVILKSG